MDSDNTGLSDVIDELESELDTLITRLEAAERERDWLAHALAAKSWMRALPESRGKHSEAMTITPATHLCKRRQRRKSKQRRRQPDEPTYSC